MSDESWKFFRYTGSMITHDWDVSFEKFGGLPTVVAFWKN